MKQDQAATEAGGVITREEIPAIRRIAAKLTPLAISALVANLVSQATSPTEKRKSAELILAYGWGRPINTTALEPRGGDKIIIDQQLQERIADTFTRIDTFLANTQINDDTKKILDPILELEHILADPANN